MYLKVKHRNIEFDRTIWMNNPRIRAYMVSSIIHDKLIIGLSKEEVVNFLGFEFNDKHSDKWTYYIEKKSFFYFKKKLYIHFDDFDKVLEVIYK